MRSAGKVGWPFLLSVLVVLPLWLAPTAGAEEAPRLVEASSSTASPSLGFDRIDLRFGGGWVFGAHTTLTLLSELGIGSTVDYDETLDGQTSSSFYRFDGTWRWAKKHGLTYSWYDVNRTGVRTIDQSIDFGDQHYAVGAKVDSQLDIKLHRLFYRYSLARTDEFGFDIGGGLYFANINMTLTANSYAGPNSGMATSGISLTAPLPTAGVAAECKITKRLTSFFSADWFYIQINEWEGNETDSMVGLLYDFTKNWSIGAAYDRFTINMKGPVNHGTFKVDNVWNTLLGFVRFHF